MEARKQAERDRLYRAFHSGPGRRMIADALADRPLTTADMEQGSRYLRLMAALDTGRA